MQEALSVAPVGSIGDHHLTAADGFRLAATLFVPAQANGISVQINSASWTPRHYYRHFASYLAECGFTVLTYDYRGIGESKTENTTADLSLLSWGTQDQPAATRFLKEHFPGQRLTVLAHSFGGQILGLSPFASEIRAALIVATAHGYWKRWPNRKDRLLSWLNWQIVVPFIAPMYGYLPKRFGGIVDLPLHTARELRRYAMHPDFFCDAAGQAIQPYNDQVQVPLRLIAIEDDRVVPPGAELDIRHYYPHALHRIDCWAPADWGLAEIGHFGIFRRSMPLAMWQDMADWLVRNG